MTTETTDFWPADDEWVMAPSPEDVERERQLLAMWDRADEYTAYLECQAELWADESDVEYIGEPVEAF